MATSRQRVEDEDSEGLGGVVHLPMASYCSKVVPRSPPNRNLDSPSNMVRQHQELPQWIVSLPQPGRAVEPVESSSENFSESS